MTAPDPACVCDLARSVSRAIEAASQHAGDPDAENLLSRAGLRVYQASSLAMEAARILRADPAGSTGRSLDGTPAIPPCGAAEPPHLATCHELALAVASVADLAEASAEGLGGLPAPAGVAASEMTRAAGLLDAALVPLAACEAATRRRAVTL